MESFLRLANVCRFLGVEKHVIRKWVGRLQPLASLPTKERSAMEFSGADLLFLESVRILILETGLSVDAVAEFSRQLHEAVQRPWASTGDENLIIVRVLSEKKWQISGRFSGPAVTVQIPLGEIQRRVMSALGVTGEWQQRELSLGLIDANARKIGT